MFQQLNKICCIGQSRSVAAPPPARTAPTSNLEGQRLDSAAPRFARAGTTFVR